MKDVSYTESHTKENKDVSYEEYYAKNKWQQFLSYRESEFLRSFVASYFSGTKVRYLDFACGTGRIAAAIEDVVSESFGVDVSLPMLDQARKKLQNTTLINSDLLKEDGVLTGEFDLITAFRFFLNAEEELRDKALKVLCSLVKSDGIILFNNHRNSDSVLTKFKYRGKNRNFMSIQEMYDLAERNGLEIIEIYPIGFLSPYKFNLPRSFNNIIDRTLLKFKRFHSSCECPIAICKKRK